MNIDLDSLNNNDIVNVDFNDGNMLNKLQSLGDDVTEFEQC